MFSHEHSSGIVDFLDPTPGIANRKAKMLGGIFIRQLHGLVQIAGQHRAAPIFKRSRNDFRASSLLDLPPDFNLHLFDQGL
jgi:hypothetical protein